MKKILLLAGFWVTVTCQGAEGGSKKVYQHFLNARASINDATDASPLSRFTLLTQLEEQIKNINTNDVKEIRALRALQGRIAVDQAKIFPVIPRSGKRLIFD